MAETRQQKHLLPNGREVYFVRCIIVGTYAGMLEGTERTASKYNRETLAERAGKLLSPGRPLAIVDESALDLPRWLCVAELASNLGVKNSDPDFNSRLYVCWFMADTSQSLDDALVSILPRINWEQTAEDFDVMDF